MLATRKDGGYKHEMANADHGELIKTVLEYSGMVMLSAYDHAIYDPLARAGWDKTIFRTASHVAGRTRAGKLQGKGAALKHAARTEVVWRNPAAVERAEGARLLDNEEDVR